VDDNDGSKYVEYNKIQEMSYMDAFIMESLRMYPLTPLERLTTKPYKVSNGTTEFVIPKGMLVGIPSNFMKDERYFKDPKKFDPENFSTESKALRGPYPFIAFGHGPRNCIGMRFALLNLKLAMFRLLFDYKIVPCSKTVDELILDPKSMNGSPIGEIWVALEERK
jgi:cytochrome P450